MRRRFGLSRKENKWLFGILALLLAISLAIAIYETFTGRQVPAGWSSPIILAALCTVVLLINSLPEIRTDVRYLREVADSVRVQRMETIHDFYDSLSRAVDEAENTLDLTHIRDSPPADFGIGAGAFFDKLLDWCTAADDRSIRRIISIRTTPMYIWAQTMSQETEHLRQFNIRVIDWSIDSPALNMAIVDGKATYLAITGATPQRTKGLGIEDKTASQYFSDYYENLWRSSKDLPVWLASTTWEGG